jgi:Pao retrotransposon peptidase
MITKGFYLDDLMYGSDDKAKTINLVSKIYNLFEKHGMILRKWSSNFPTCLLEIKEGHTLLDRKEIVKAENKVSTLGMSWNPKADTLMYKICLGDDKSFMKRMILSEAARTFDPTGLLLPLTIRARLLLTSLWKQKLEWDEQIPETKTAEWITIPDQIKRASHLEIKRQITTNQAGTTTIKMFCDASEKASGVAIYIGNKDITDLVIAKGKVTNKSLQRFRKWN